MLQMDLEKLVKLREQRRHINNRNGATTVDVAQSRNSVLDHRNSSLEKEHAPDDSS